MSDTLAAAIQDEKTACEKAHALRQRVAELQRVIDHGTDAWCHAVRAVELGRDLLPDELAELKRLHDDGVAAAERLPKVTALCKAQARIADQAAAKVRKLMQRETT